MTLGELKEALSMMPQNADLVIGDYNHFGDLGSYRGYYSDLAVSRGDKPIKVQEVLSLLNDATGTTFEGYKGGQNTMHNDVDVYLAEWGCLGESVDHVYYKNGMVYIHTIQEY